MGSLDILVYMNKIAFWLSGNPLRLTLGAKCHLYFFRSVQCSLIWHVLQADIPDMCNVGGGPEAWLACASVGGMYSRPSVTECEYSTMHMYVNTVPCTDWGEGVTHGCNRTRNNISLNVCLKLVAFWLSVNLLCFNIGAQ